MRIMITGASGFIGRHLLKRFQSIGIDVSVYRGNILDCSSDQFDGIDTVVHLASIHTQSSVQWREIDDVVGSRKLFSCCCYSGVKKIIFPSSGGAVYGVVDDDPIVESDPTNPISPYGISKLAIEKYLHYFHYHNGLNYTILRISNPYGLNQSIHKGNGVICNWLTRIAEGKPIEIMGDGNAIRDYIYISDVVGAIIRSMHDSSNQKILNIGSGTGYCLNEIVDIIREIVGVDFEIIRRPGRKVDVPVNVLHCGLAREVLEWSPKIKIRDGIRLLWEQINESRQNKPNC
jgi:UDP-glucose 4-epimerase